MRFGESAGGDLIWWIVGLAGLVLAAGTAWTLRGRTRPPRRARGAPAHVLVMALAGDRGDRLGAQIRAALTEVLGAAFGDAPTHGLVRAWRARSPWFPVAASPDALGRAEAAWLAAARQAGADVVVWGGVDSGDGDALLRIAPTGPEADATVVGVGRRVAEEGFAPGMDVALAALVASASPEGRAVMAPLRARIAEHAANPDPALSGADRCRLREACGRLSFAAFADGGAPDVIEDAVAAARLSVSDGRAATTPAEAASAQALLGRGLMARAAADQPETAEARAAAQEAATALRAALAGPAAWTPDEQTRLRLGFAEAVAHWAALSESALWVDEALAAAEAAARDARGNGAGGAVLMRARLRALAGERLGGAKRLEAAVAGYADALAAVDAAADPRAWAVAQMGLGRALTALGARRQGVETLDSAVAAFDAVLAREGAIDAAAADFDWAAVHAARGEALAALGERSGESATPLTAAASALRAAISQSEARGGARLAAQARRTLARVERLLAERRAGSSI